jgi:hypothetical protein
MAWLVVLWAMNSYVRQGSASTVNASQLKQNLMKIAALTSCISLNQGKQYASIPPQGKKGY